MASGRFEKVAASDRNSELCKSYLLPGIALLKADDPALACFALHVAIGDNAARERECAWWGVEPLATVQHLHASVSTISFLGPGCFIAAGAIVACGAVLGRSVIVNHGAVVDHDSRVGDFCHLAPNATLGGGVCLGDRNLVGAGAVILPGLQIASDVIIGAGAVVIKHITSAGTYAGIPARRIK